MGHDELAMTEPRMPATSRTFAAEVEPRPGGGVAIKVPFDPSTAWGAKDRHYVAGTIGGFPVRGTVTEVGDDHFLLLGPTWCRDPRVGPGARVTVSLAPEGPQVAALASDLRAAFAAEPGARRFFESLATFYRKGYIDWVEAAKRPETRAKRIAEMLVALKASNRQR